MKSKNLCSLIVLAVLLVSILPAAAAVAPPEPASPGGGGIQSLSGSFVEFAPSAGGAVCFIPGETQTFCFEARSYTDDWEYVYYLWQRFPTDWTVLDVYVQGTPTCSSGASWGSFGWSFQTSPYEVRIAHARYQATSDDCVAYYCFEVVSGSGTPYALESWYWDGDGYGGTPHWPCSDDQYTPAGQTACDEYVNPQAAIPPCADIGWLEGYVMDSETGDVDPTCTDAVVHVEPGDLDVPVDPFDGSFGPVGLVSGTYTVEATAPGYSLEATMATVTAEMTTTADFNLWRPVVEVEPTDLISVTAYVDVETTYPLTISNLGHLPLDFEIHEIPPDTLSAASYGAYRPEPAAVGIDRQIYEEMAAAADGKTDFFIAFEDTADLSPAFHMPWSERGRFVVDALQAAANTSQAGAKAWLDRQGIEYTSYWINNTLFVHADEAALNALVSFPGVAGFEANYVSQLMPVEEVAAPLTDNVLAPAYPWNTGSSTIGSARADMVHNDYGLRGEGIVVGGMDTGVLYNHVGLIQNYRGCLDPPACTIIDHTYSWEDPDNDCGGTPCDNNGHGTATMGIMAGDDDPSLPNGAWIGMAPNAQWIHCLGCPAGSCPGDVTSACAQWFLAPGGDSDMRPQVVNHSWGLWSPDNCNGNAFQAELMAYRAADILPAFAAGNVGDYVTPPHCFASTSPANNTNTSGAPIAFASGAHGTAGTLDYYSSGGPNACNYDYLFPDVTSPGSGSCTTTNGGGYYCSFGGTSSASPHTAGCAALVRQAAPTLSIGPDTLSSPIEEALREGATDVDDSCGEPGETPDWNNKYGEGNLNCYEAVGLAFQHDLPWVWEDPVTGTVPVEDEIVVDVTFLCTQTQDYSGTLRILHNDPCQGDIDVPIVLHCLEPSAPILYLTKDATPGVQYPGWPVTYTLTFGNDGGTDATGAVISDVLPAEVEYLSSDPPGAYDPVAHEVSWSADLLAGGAMEVTILVLIDEAAVPGTWLTNTAYLYWEDTTLMDEAATLVEEEPVPDLYLTKDATPLAQVPGEPLTYTLTFGNDGDGDAAGAVISDVLPAEVEYVSSDPPGAYDPVAHEVSWIVDLPAGGAMEATILVLIDEAAVPGTWLTNTAYLYWEDIALMAEAATLVEAPPVPDLYLAKEGAPMVQLPGGPLTYTLGFGNDGDADAIGAVISDVLPAEVEYVSSDPPGTYYPGLHQVSWSVDLLVNDAMEATILVTIDEAVGSGTWLTNTAYLFWEETALMAEAATLVEEEPVALLGLTKGATPTVQYPGGAVTYTLGLVNNGNGDATGAVISDVLPAEVEYVSSDPPGAYDPAAHEVSWIVDLPAGEAMEATIVVTIDGAAVPGTWLTNTAYLFWEDTALMAEAATLVEAPPEPEPDLGVTKDVTPTVQVPGGVVTYTLVFGNEGDADAMGVVISDVLPAGVEYVSSDPAGTYDAVAHQVSWTVDLMMGQVMTATIVVHIGADVEGGTWLTNTVYLYWEETELTAEAAHYVASPPGFYLYLPIICRNFP